MLRVEYYLPEKRINRNAVQMPVLNRIKYMIMAAILDISHFCRFYRKNDDLTEFSMPFYIYTQDFINRYAVLAELLGKI